MTALPCSPSTDSVDLEYIRSAGVSQKRRRNYFGSRRGIFHTGSTKISSSNHYDCKEKVIIGRRKSSLDNSHLCGNTDVTKRSSLVIPSVEPTLEFDAYNTRGKRSSKTNKQFSIKGLSLKSLANPSVGGEDKKAVGTELQKIETDSNLGAFTSPKKLQRIRLLSRKKRDKIKQRNSGRVSRKLDDVREIEPGEEKKTPSSTKKLKRFFSKKGRRKTAHIDVARTESMTILSKEPSVKFGSVVSRESSCNLTLTTTSIKPSMRPKDLSWKREKIKKRNVQKFSILLDEEQVLTSKEALSDYYDSEESAFQHECSNSNFFSSKESCSTSSLEKFSLTPIEEQQTSSREEKESEAANVEEGELSRNSSTNTSSSPSSSLSLSKLELESVLKRIATLEHLVTVQSSEISELKYTCNALTETNIALSNRIHSLETN